MSVLDAETEAALARLAADLVSPVGQVPFERVARRHGEVLGSLRGRGLTWTQVGLLLHRHGIAREDGSPLSGAQLSSVSSRQRKVPRAAPLVAGTVRPASPPGVSGDCESPNAPRPTERREPPPAVAREPEGSGVRSLGTPMDRDAIKASLARQRAIRDRIEEGEG